MNSIKRDFFKKVYEELNVCSREMNKFMIWKINRKLVRVCSKVFSTVMGNVQFSM